MASVIPYKKILLVEDDKAIRTMMKELLELHGHSVFVAENGDAALKVLERIPKPELILLDMMMPVMDGRAFLKAKKENPRIASIPVILVSANNHRSEKLDVEAYVAKPIELDTLLPLIDNLSA